METIYAKVGRTLVTGTIVKTHYISARQPIPERFDVQTERGVWQVFSDEVILESEFKRLLELQKTPKPKRKQKRNYAAAIPLLSDFPVCVIAEKLGLDYSSLRKYLNRQNVSGKFFKPHGA